MRNKGAHLAIEKRPLSFVLAGLMHALLLAFLFLGTYWQSQPATPLEVELWGDLPAPVPRQGDPNGVAHAPATDVPQVAIAPANTIEPVDSEPDIVVEQTKPPTTNEHKTAPDELATARRDKLPRPKQALAKVDHKMLVRKTPVNKEASADPLDLRNLVQGAANGRQSERATAGNAQSSAGGTSQVAGGRKGELLAVYLNQLQQMIREKTVYSDRGAGNPSAVLKIFILPDGTIRDVHIVSSSGDPAFAMARKQALLMMQRLPPLPPGIHFSEQREWTVRTRLRE